MTEATVRVSVERRIEYPVFGERDYRASVAESAAVNSSVLTVQARLPNVVVS